MLAAFVGFVMLVSVVAIAAGRSRAEDGSDVYTDYMPSPPPPPRERGSRTRFIEKHLHRNDEKHSRHKRNQTPW